MSADKKMTIEEAAEKGLLSADVAQEKRDALKQLFPEVFTEDTIDFEQLRRVMGDWVEPGKERYGLNWPGKAECMKVIQAPSIATLKPARDESVNFYETENLFIEGDNLEVLKLLQKAYFGKIKMIYIDPPYNTGKEFIYPDKYQENLDTYLAYTEQVDDEGKKFATNTDSSGRFHSNWLNMMFPRLYLARNLLREDGVIFISIGNDEFENLVRLCHLIFGEENFIECLTWNKRVPKNDKGIGNIHEYILLYVKDASLKPEFNMRKDGLDDVYELVGKLKRDRTSIPEAELQIKRLYKKNDYDRGITLYNSLDFEYRLWGKINMSWPNANTFGPDYEVLHPRTNKPVKMPDRGWRWKEETFNEAANRVDGVYQNVIELHDGSFMCGKIWFSKDEQTQPSSITYFDDVNNFLLRSIISTKSDGGVEVENLFEGKNFFSYPKPTHLIKTLLSSQEANDEDIFLDFFAGSATTAHALMDMSAEDDVRRKYIMVQLPEHVEEGSEAHKNGYKTVSDLSKERMRRAANKIANQGNGKLNLDGSAKQDLGFKVFKLDQSNFNLWDGDAEKTEDLAKQLELHVDHIDQESSPEDILYELLLKAGFELTTKVEKKTMAGKDVYAVSDGAMLICLDKEITPELIDALADANPLQVICLDEGFKGNDQLKTNAVQTFKSRAKEDEEPIVFRTV